MTYLLLDAAFLAAVAVIALVAIVLRRPPRWITVALAAGVLVVVSAAFDNIMIGVGLVAYDPSRISGMRIGIAPVEDLAYALAAAVLLPSLWCLLRPAASGPVSETPGG
jgi:lycopene cyclase domain-containing protein